jgi:DmsE family decaheme c-type cytochrome
MVFLKKAVLITFILLGIVVAFAGCRSLKESKPIFSIQEYELMLVGTIDANYVGTETCLSACHFHDEYRRDFEASTMGAQLSSDSGMPMVDCETCHGPGSRAIVGITKARVEEDRKKGIQTECRHDTLIDIKNLPPGANSLMCLKCHTSNATFNLHEWNAGDHALSDVTCIDCHDVHIGADLITSPRETKDMCLKCHQDMRAQFSLRSHHPVNESKVFCTDCHGPHGSMGKKLLRANSIKETCTKCHPDKQGPFLYEHADLNEDCMTCHLPHGSPYNSLLVTQETFMCLQCHSGHKAYTTSTSEARAAFYTRCTDCHATIHGTDLPSPGGGTFLH